MSLFGQRSTFPYFRKLIKKRIINAKDNTNAKIVTKRNNPAITALPGCTLKKIAPREVLKILEIVLPCKFILIILLTIGSTLSYAITYYNELELISQRLSSSPEFCVSQLQKYLLYECYYAGHAPFFKKSFKAYDDL